MINSLNLFSPCLLAIMLFSNPAIAGSPVTPAPTPVACETLADACCHHYADSPIGVMFDHVHGGGGFMTGYRYFFSQYGGLQKNGDGISTKEVFKDGFSMAPVDMEMHMHMLEFMWSPTDWLTLMVMPMYMQMDMEMQSGGGGHGHGGHEDAHGARSGTHSHGTSGFGDTNVSAIFKLWQNTHQQVVGTIGLSIPTGSVDEKVGRAYTHYMMQLGSGTWDLTPSLTYKGQSGNVFWGGQYLAALRLEKENDSGYRLGNVHQGTVWAGVDLCEWANLTGRAAYRHEGRLRGHYNGAHNHGSPPDFQANYGGDSLDLGVGVNFVIPKGILKGNRFGIEALWPVWQDLNGIQLEREFTLIAGWQWTF